MSAGPYRSDIDGLRALAVLPVVLFHVDPSRMPGGFLGVDIFFVISGYLISLLLYREHATGGISLAGFYRRRIRRLFPALIVVLLATLALGYFALWPAEYIELGRQAQAAIFFLLNFKLISETGYFDVASFNKPLMHLWSLSVEEQFYLAWPVLLMLTYRLRVKLAWALIFCATLSLAYAIWRATRNLDAVYYDPLARFWELLVGAIVAYLHFTRAATRCPLAMRSVLLQHAASWIGLLLIVTAMLFFNRSIPHPGAATLWPVLGAALVIACGPEAGANRLLAWRPLVLVGLISYPLYLWHWPMLSFVRIMEFGDPDAVFLWLAAILSIVFAGLTYRWIELPIRRATGRGRAWQFLAGAMIVPVLVSVVIVDGGGAPDRSALRDVRGGVAELTRAPAQDASCLALFPSGSAPVYCRQRMPGERMIAIIGDSHAHAVFPGVAELAAQKGYGTLLLANSGCPPFVGTTWGRTDAARKQCVRNIDRIVQAILGDRRVASVLIVSRGPIYISGTGFGPAEQDYNTPPIAFDRPSGKTAPVLASDAFTQGLLNTVRQIQQRGDRVAYLLQVPELGLAPRNCLARPLSFTSRLGPCDVPYADYVARMRDYRNLMQGLVAKAPGLRLIDVEPDFCSRRFCSGMRQQQLLYADDNHLGLNGSRLVAPQILAQLLPDKAPGH
ncbi:MAG: acyltransferase family protein [Betaproteobacteria bacterium]